MIYPKGDIIVTHLELDPFVVKGRPGVPDSRPSELTPSPGLVWSLDIRPVCVLWLIRQALARAQAGHMGSGSRARSGPTL